VARSRIAALVWIALLAAALGIGAAIAGDPLGGSAPPPPGDAGRIGNAVAAGKHVRIEGPRGPVHVWIPAGYHADTGATILYVHGYFDDADTAWTGHQLPEQFALSALNAMFIVPEAPVAQRTPINYPDLGELLRLVEDRTGAVRGAALTVVVGHSGAFRTIQAWLDEPLVDQIVMVDAMYGEENLILTWYRGSTRRRLISVGEDTLLGTESFASKIPETVTIDRFPPTYDTWPAEARTARHLYIRAQYAHMPLVNEGIVLPSLLRLLPVELLANLPWRLPLGSLPPLPDAAIDVTDAIPAD
jgi:hypothetical protein